MKKASFVVDEYYGNNRIFDLDDPIRNRDNCLYTFHLLKEELLRVGYVLATDDINRPAESELSLYLDCPEKLTPSNRAERSYLLLLESPVVRPDIWKKSAHTPFDKVYTWNDDLVDRARYFKINYSQRLDIPGLDLIESKRNFCTMIAGNKRSRAPHELYSARREAIHWFEANHPDQFDLYGTRWDERTFDGGRFQRYLNHMSLLKRLLPAEQFPSYAGPIADKKSVLAQYRFSICYENAAQFPGYITEKIFDSFASLCVPVYLGAPNITDYVPQECFIDRRNFSDLPALYDFLQLVSAEKYTEICRNIVDFLKSDRAKRFSSTETVRRIVELSVVQSS